MHLWPRSALALILAVAVALVAGGAASADDGWRFRRTTPRAELAAAADGVAIGVPAGRAWGIESALVRLPPRAGARLLLEIEVRDPAVREAFVRVAYYGPARTRPEPQLGVRTSAVRERSEYARSDGRSRQIAVADSVAVVPGEARRVELELDPPDGAVAYRLRVLARLVPDAARSAAGAIRVGAPRLLGAAPRPSLTRLAE